MGLPPAPRVGNPGVGGAPLALGGGGQVSPWPPPPLVDGIQGRRPPRGPIYSGGEGGQPHPSPWRLPLPPVTPLPLAELGEALPRSATSTTTPSCCWISINLSFPLAGSRRRRRRCSVRVFNAEVPSVRRSVIGDLDHDEYDSINPVLLNASASRSSKV